MKLEILDCRLVSLEKKAIVKDNRSPTNIFKLNKFEDKQKTLRNAKKLKITEIYILWRLLQWHSGSKEIFVG